MSWQNTFFYQLNVDQVYFSMEEDAALVYSYHLSSDMSVFSHVLPSKHPKLNHAFDSRYDFNVLFAMENVVNELVEDNFLQKHIQT